MEVVVPFMDLDDPMNNRDSLPSILKTHISPGVMGALDIVRKRTSPLSNAGDMLSLQLAIV